MREKWKDDRGETLIEVLASILVMALSVLLLFGAVIVSSRINKAAMEADKDFYAAQKAAEAQETVLHSGSTGDIIPADPKVTVKIYGTEDKKDVKVNFYGGKGALSYKYKEP